MNLLTGIYNFINYTKKLSKYIMSQVFPFLSIELRNYLKTHSGLQTVQAIKSRKISDPFCNHLSLNFKAAVQGYAEIGCSIAKQHNNFAGIAHGGFMFSIMDMSAWMASQAYLYTGNICLTSLFEGKLRAPVTSKTLEVTAIAQSEKVSSNVYKAKVLLKDCDSNQEFAYSTFTCPFFRLD